MAYIITCMIGGLTKTRSPWRSIYVARGTIGMEVLQNKPIVHLAHFVR
jgi:hypothetical protein